MEKEEKENKTVTSSELGSDFWNNEPNMTGMDECKAILVYQESWNFSKVKVSISHGEFFFSPRLSAEV